MTPEPRPEWATAMRQVKKEEVCRDGVGASQTGAAGSKALR